MFGGGGSGSKSTRQQASAHARSPCPCAHKRRSQLRWRRSVAVKREWPAGRSPSPSPSPPPPFHGARMRARARARVLAVTVAAVDQSPRSHTQNRALARLRSRACAHASLNRRLQLRARPPARLRRSRLLTDAPPPPLPPLPPPPPPSPPPPATRTRHSACASKNHVDRRRAVIVDDSSLVNRLLHAPHKNWPLRKCARATQQSTAHNQLDADRASRRRLHRRRLSWLQTCDVEAHAHQISAARRLHASIRRFSGRSADRKAPRLVAVICERQFHVCNYKQASDLFTRRVKLTRHRDRDYASTRFEPLEERWAAAPIFCAFAAPILVCEGVDMRVCELVVALLKPRRLIVDA